MRGAIANPSMLLSRDRIAQNGAILFLIVLVVVLFARYVYDVRATFDADVPLLDFQAYFTAGKAIATHENPYQFDSSIEVLPYKYPPTLALILSALSSLSTVQAQRIWLVVDVILLWVATLLSTSVVLRSRPLRFLEILLTGCAVLGAYQVYTNFKLGQVGATLYFFVALAFWLWQHGRRVMAAFAIAVAIAIKVLPLALLIFLVWKKEYRMVLYTIFFALLIQAIPDVVFQTHLLSQYVLAFGGFYGGGDPQFLAYFANQSWLGVIARLAQVLGLEVSTGLILLSMALGGIMFALTIALSSRDMGPSDPVTVLEYTNVLVAILLLNTVSWTHYFVWLLFMIPSLIYILFKRFQNGPKRSPWVITTAIIVGYVLMSQPFRIPRIMGFTTDDITVTLGVVGTLLQSLFFYGVFLIWLMASWLMYQHLRAERANAASTEVSVKPQNQSIP